MLKDEDLNVIRDSRDRLGALIDKIDCPVCRAHYQLVLDLLDDVIPITRFNTLYVDDPGALARYRSIVQKEYMLRVMGVGAHIVGISRRIRMWLSRRHRAAPRQGGGDTPRS